MGLDSSDEDVDEYQLDEVNDPGSELMQALMEAEALGLVNEDVAHQDEQQEVVPELPITPFREPRLQLPLATSTLKRDARSSSSPALSEEVRSAPSQRRRLYTKQPGEEPVKKPAAAFEFSDDIDGVRIDAHQLFKTYTRLKPETRRLISKKVSQNKYRALEQLKHQKSTTIYGKLVEFSGDTDWETVRRLAERLLFHGMARDSTLEDVKRGYAMSVLVGELRNDSFQTTSDQSGAMRITGLPAILLTYIGEYGIVDVMSLTFSRLDGLPGSRELSYDERWELLQSMPADSVALLLQVHPTAHKLATALETLGVESCNRLRTPHWSMCTEVCAKTLQNRVLRIHGHLWITLKRQTVLLEQFKLPGTSYLPYVNWNAIQFLEGKSTRCAQSGYSGNVYTAIKKIGTIAQLSTLNPWADYPIRDVWITNLYSAGKITYQTAKQAYINTVHRVGYNLQALELVHEAKRKRELVDKMHRIEAELRATFRPWKTIDVVTEYQQQYLALKARYKFLVLDGDSCHGKTWFALSLNGIGRTLYTDCTAGFPNLKEYDGALYDAILMDEITPKCAIGIKKAMQASNELVTLGSSPTMCSAYTVHLHRCQIICCSNVWKAGLKKLNKADRNWLIANSFYVSVTEAMWVEPVAKE